MAPFARAIDAAKKYVVSSTLDRVDWNAELVRGDLAKAVRQLKRESGKGLFVGGVKLPLALAELGLIDEYEFVVHPRLAGHGPTLFAGLSKHIDLKLVSRLEFGSGRWRCGMSLEGSHRLSARFASKTTRLEKGLRDAVSDDELLVMAGITHQRSTRSRRLFVRSSVPSACRGPLHPAFDRRSADPSWNPRPDRR
jgi:dihydrofolate reductase